MKNIKPLKLILRETTIQTVRRILQVMMMKRKRRIENKLTFLDTLLSSILTCLE